MNKSLEILKRKGYFIKVQKKGNTYEVNYPAHIILDTKSEAFSKQYTLDKMQDYHCEKMDVVKIDDEIMYVPTYLTKSVIYADIISQARYLNISHNLILFYNEDDKEFSTIYDMDKLSGEDGDKEQLFKQLVLGDNKIDMEKTKSVFRQYKMIRGLI